MRAQIPRDVQSFSHKQLADVSIMHSSSAMRAGADAPISRRREWDCRPIQLSGVAKADRGRSLKHVVHDRGSVTAGPEEVGWILKQSQGGPTNAQQIHSIVCHRVKSFASN